MAYMKIIIKSLDSNRNFVALPLAPLGVRQVQQSAIPIVMHTDKSHARDSDRANQMRDSNRAMSFFYHV